jgi:two-component sensor histidine kinase/integral membrane sensor domain MASE1
MTFRLVVISTLLAGVYLCAAILGLSLAVPGTNVSAVWPPAGIALAAILLFGSRIWPGITAGAFLANYLIGLSPIGCAVTAIGNTAEALCASFLIRRWVRSTNYLSRTKDIVYFLLAIATGTAIAATIGITASYLTGFSHGIRHAYLWLTWWLGDTVAIVVLTPLFIAWLQRKRPFLSRNVFAKFLLSLTLLCLLGVIIFTVSFRHSSALSYLTLLPLLGIAFTYDERGASAGALALSIIAIWSTLRGHGPFLAVSVHESLLLLQLFLGVTTVTALIVSATIAEKRVAEETIRSQLIEKELLMSEIHHRVKNNLQVISSLLGLQLLQADENSRQLLKESQNRLRSMALIHEQLYSSGNLSQIDFEAYVRDLVQQLFSAYGIRPERVNVRIHSECLTLDIGCAVPCALILNEIVTNSLKHAFRGSNPGEIAIRCYRSNGKTYLEASDNGPGIPADLQSAGGPKSLGLKLITLLVKQLNGTMEVNAAHGTAFKIEF